MFLAKMVGAPVLLFAWEGKSICSTPTTTVGCENIAYSSLALLRGLANEDSLFQVISPEGEEITTLAELSKKVLTPADDNTTSLGQSPELFLALILCDTWDDVKKVAARLKKTNETTPLQFWRQEA